MNPNFFQKIPEVGDFLLDGNQDLCRIIDRKGSMFVILYPDSLTEEWTMTFTLMNFKVLSPQEVEEWKAKSL